MKALGALTGCCLLAASLAVVFGSKADAQTGCQAGDTLVPISGQRFTQATVNIQPGGSVCWTNQDAVEHTVSSDSGAFNSGAIAPGGTFRFTFSADGVFRYHCAVHPTMTASVIVGTPPQPPPPPPPPAQRVSGFRASVVRSGGRRWLVARARVTRAGRAQLRLQRRNRTVASARKQFRRGQNTLRLALRMTLPRGSYVARLTVAGARRPNTARIAIR
jgi:plastocyanin